MGKRSDHPITLAPGITAQSLFLGHLGCGARLHEPGRALREGMSLGRHDVLVPCVLEARHASGASSAAPYTEI